MAKQATPIIQEVDLLLREVESGQLSKSESINSMESLCRKVRGHLRAEYGLEAANHLNAILGQGRGAG